MERRWLYYKRANNVELRMKGSWANGVYGGLNRKLESTQTQTEQTKFNALPVETRATVQTKYALVLKDSAEKVEDFVHQRYPEIRNVARSRTTCDYGSSHYSQGFATGQSMSINRPVAGQAAIA